MDVCNPHRRENITYDSSEQIPPSRHSGTYLCRSPVHVLGVDAPEVYPTFGSECHKAE
jgi:hypothetical protein